MERVKWGPLASSFMKTNSAILSSRRSTCCFSRHLHLCPTLKQLRMISSVFQGSRLRCGGRKVRQGSRERTVAAPAAFV